MQSSIKNNKKITKKALIFTAHPDDHICAAGTLMFLKDRGFEIHEIVATGGERGVWWQENKKQRGFDFKKLEGVRKKELEKASKLIGITNTTFLGLPDSGVERSIELVERITAIVRKERPSIVFIMHPNDYHIDHRQVGLIATEGVERASWYCRPELGDSIKVPVVLYIEGIYFNRADVLVDITPYWKKKSKLVDIYSSQIDSAERRLLESMNFYHGFTPRDKNSTVAEAFEIPREFPINLNLLAELFS